MHAALIVKATRLCNLRCHYCNDWRSGHHQIMPFEVLAALIDKALSDPLHKSLDFIWHGGEPTLLGREFFSKAIYVQARLRRDDQRISNSLQTNGTMIDNAWARFLRENRFWVSVSVDGPAAVHDRQRPHVSGRGSFGDVMDGIARLRDHDIPVSVLMVIDRDTLELGPDYVFDFLVEHEITSFGLLAAKPKNDPGALRMPAAHYVTPAEMARFLCGMFDRWVEHGDPGIRVREFGALLRRIDGQAASTCVLAGNCFGSYYLIEPDGEAAHCDLFLGDPAYVFGNIRSGSFAEFRSTEAMTALRAQRNSELEGMRRCPNFGICNGWCPHERYTALHHDIDFTGDCCGLSPLIDHIKSRFDRSTGAGALTAVG